MGIEVVCIDIDKNTMKTHSQRGIPHRARESGKIGKGDQETNFQL